MGKCAMPFIVSEGTELINAQAEPSKQSLAIAGRRIGQAH